MNERKDKPECRNISIPLKLSNADRFPIPEFDIAFEIKVNPHYTYNLAVRSAEYVFESSNMSRERFEKIKNCGLASAYCYPHCDDLERVEHLIKYFTEFFVFDDHTETDWGDVGHSKAICQDIWAQFSRSFDKLTSDEFISLSDCKPYVLSTHAVMETIFSKFNHVQKLRASECWKGYIRGNIMEVDLWGKNIIIKDFEEYMSVRELTIGLIPTVQFMEYALDIFLFDEEWNNEEFKKFLKLNTRLVILINDIMSFEKEFYENNELLDKMYNSVALISRNKKLSVEKSMIEIIGIYKKLEKEYLELESKMLNDKIYRDDFKTFIKDMAYIISSTYMAELLIDRYRSIEDFQGNPLEKFDKYLLI